ncbi:DNA-binding transcriptional regulator, MerR family [Microbispora rosea]|uniref:DNA-binding transcriptional regulator, MerR family n=1 Tax=Microbispora rosea TaxID=58117 RepID=A0A1N6YDU5_9ACTN|nr:MerR family transcriptional regulator [Microbispora rosea]GIH47129.1 MerR family transcriptional regulator [Microbispora rosea subsp. rosea]SIR12747.1 DNA-binding transcriptional regulator, MerR family [Microbispora rosea]
MAWSIAQVAQMSGVTSRTLRHYDEIGLLLPARVGGNGYRYYEENQLLRLQQVLVLRELGLGLAEIKEIVERHTDPIAALREHHQRVLAERDRLDEVARMVERTIAELQQNEGKTTMSKISRPENLFEGFDGARYAADARERWPEQWQQSGQKELLASRTPQELEQMQREATAGMIRMAEHMLAGTPVDAPQVFAELDVHYRHLSESWTPTAAQYLHLARMQAQEEQFRANYERVAEGLAEYMCDAMTAYAHARLS